MLAVDACMCRGPDAFWCSLQNGDWNGHILRSSFSFFQRSLYMDPIWRSGGAMNGLCVLNLFDMSALGFFCGGCTVPNVVPEISHCRCPAYVQPRQHGFVWGTRTPFCRFLSSSRGFRLVRCGWSMFGRAGSSFTPRIGSERIYSNQYSRNFCFFHFFSGCRTWEFDGWACGSRYAGFGFGSGAPSQRVLGAALCARNWVSCNGNRRPFPARFPAEAAAVLDPQQIPHAEDNPMGSFDHKHLYYIPLCNLLHDDILSLLQQKAELPVTKWTVFTSFPFLQLEFDAWYAWWPFGWFWMQVKLAYTFSDIPRQNPSIYGKLQLI